MSISGRRIAALLLLAATFLIGLIAGITLDRFSLIRERRLVPRPGAFASNHVVRRLDRVLDLTPDQEQKVRAIVERRRARVETLWRESQPRIDEEMESAHREIDALLDPEQRVKFEKVLQRWRHFAGPRPSGQASERPETGRPQR